MYILMNPNSAQHQACEEAAASCGRRRERTPRRCHSRDDSTTSRMELTRIGRPSAKGDAMLSSESIKSDIEAARQYQTKRNRYLAERSFKQRLQEFMLLSPVMCCVLVEVIMLSANVRIPYAELKEPVPVDRLYNFWLCVLLGLSPLLVVSHIWLAVFHHSQVILLANGRTLFLIDAKSIRQAPDPSDVESLYRAAKAWAPTELLGWLLYNVHAIISSIVVCQRGMLHVGILSVDVPQTIVNVFFLPFLLVLNVIIALVLRNFRAYVIRRVEGSVASSNKFYDKWMQRAWVCVALSAFCFAYLVVLTTTAKPIVPTDPGLNGTSPCDLITGAYLERFCDVRALSSLSHDPLTYVCDDGGFGAYVSTYDACTTTAANFELVAKAVCAFGTSVNAILGLVAIPAILIATVEETTLRLLARYLLCSSVAIFTPMYVAGIVVAPLQPALLPNSFHNFSLLLLNGLLVMSGLLFVFVDLVTRRSMVGSDLDVESADGTITSGSKLLTEAVRTLERLGRHDDGEGGDSRFLVPDRSCLVTGNAMDAALGINHFMRADEHEVQRQMSEGVRAIVREVEQSGSEVDRECLDYVLNQRAGSSARRFQHGKRRDEGRNGEVLADFVNHRCSRTAHLSEAHVLALRLYTTAAFQSINQPLRDLSDERRPHPFPVTVNYIRDGISKLRAVEGRREQRFGAIGTVDLWRGMRNMTVAPDFHKHGGTELSPMSTTTQAHVALQYARSAAPLLFKIRTTSFLQRGADLDYLSAFPGEHEILYPPLTHLLPTGRTMKVRFEEQQMTVEVVEVSPIMP